MAEIKIEKNPDEAKMNEMGVFDWPVWTKERSEFTWSYDQTETCFFVDGDVIVTPDNGDPVKMGKGDFVVFPAGMSCTWKIINNVKKHYRFG